MILTFPYAYMGTRISKTPEINCPFKQTVSFIKRKRIFTWT